MDTKEAIPLQQINFDQNFTTTSSSKQGFQNSKVLKGNAQGYVKRSLPQDGNISLVGSSAAPMKSSSLSSRG